MKKEDNKSMSVSNMSVSNLSVNGDTPSKKPKKSKKTAKNVLIGLAVALGASAIVGLSVALYFSQQTVQSQAQYLNVMEAQYNRAYYDLLDSTNDLEVKLKKLSVAGTAEKQQSILYEVWGTSNVAQSSFPAFDNKSDGLMQAQRFINQLGDYSHSLALRLADGQTLSAEERNTLSKLSDMVSQLKTSLLTVKSNLDEGKSFIAGQDNLEVVDFEGAFDNFTDPSVEYPQMIYDGPFSDAVQNPEVKGLTGDEISSDAGMEKIKKYFGGKKLGEIEYIGETTGNIKTLNYNFTMDGSTAFVQLNKNGGQLVAFNMVGEKTGASSSLSPYEQAVKFATDVGYEKMQVVWSATSNGMQFVNLAPVIDKVIIYPDLVKIKIDSESGQVVGFDAMHYAFNHTDRKIPVPKLTAADARAVINMENVGEGRLALIPLRETKEVLTYEFECDNGGTYYVYIDAMTGRETEILYVIDTDHGTVLQ
jgi:germination protein YpeB